MDMVSTCIMNEELAKIDLGISESFTASASYITTYILKHGTEEQKQKCLLPATRGEKIWAFAVTESVGGSNPAANETTATRKGDKYILKGSKTFITNGGIADFLLVFAYTDKAKGPSEGMSAFILEKDMPGFTRSSMKKVGSLPSNEADLFFDDVEIPVANLVGEEGKAWRPLFELITLNRITHSARALGLAEAALEFALDYAKQRVVSGKPIAQHQAIAFKLARMATQIEAVRGLVYRAAWLCDQEDKNLPMYAAMGKFMAAETAIAVTNEAMQIQGGYALMMDSPLQRYWRDARFLAITEGTLEMLQVVISRALTK